MDDVGSKRLALIFQRFTKYQVDHLYGKRENLGEVDSKERTVCDAQDTDPGFRHLYRFVGTLRSASHSCGLDVGGEEWSLVEISSQLVTLMKSKSDKTGV